MYDISGMHREAALHAIEQDWPHLTGDLHLTDSPAYIFDRGKPVVAVWELGFKDRVIAPDQAAAIIRYLRERSCLPWFWAASRPPGANLGPIRAPSCSGRWLAP
jgi:hypothetical protein